VSAKIALTRCFRDAHFSEEESFFSQTVIPDFGFTDDQVTAIIEVLRAAQ
jgi:hypothetical protein